MPWYICCERRYVSQERLLYQKSPSGKGIKKAGDVLLSPPRGVIADPNRYSTTTQQTGAITSVQSPLQAKYRASSTQKSRSRVTPVIFPATPSPAPSFLASAMPFRHLTLKRPFYNGFVGPVPTGSIVSFIKWVDYLNAKASHVAHVARYDRHAVIQCRSGDLRIYNRRRSAMHPSPCKNSSPQIGATIIKRYNLIQVLDMPFVNPTQQHSFLCPVRKFLYPVAQLSEHNRRNEYVAFRDRRKPPHHPFIRMRARCFAYDARVKQKAHVNCSAGKTGRRFSPVSLQRSPITSERSTGHERRKSTKDPRDCCRSRLGVRVRGVAL